MTKSAFWISGVLIFGALSIFAGPPNIDMAVEAQRALIVERPYDAQVHNDMGNLMTLVERWDDAEVSYGRAIELAPTEPSARFNLALLHFQQGSLAQAQKELLKVLELAPLHGRARYQLGIIYATKGERSKAIEQYARAFAADPTLSFASNNPHIIENELRMEAILMAKRFETSRETQQPRVYGEPERIRDLMILGDGRAAAAEKAAQATPAAEASERLEDDDDDVTFRGSAARLEDDDDSEAVEAEGTSRRVLSRESLGEDGDRGRARRRPAAVGAGSGYRPPAGDSGQVGGVSRVGRGSEGQGTATETPRSTAPPKRTPRETTGAQGTAPRRPGRIGAGYRAGANSTGRLDLQLLPPTGPGSTAEVTVATRR